ncbi:uncharacterized protein [Euphorbia lathyris]|uniref:uncharacterized protein n=1 Tax=Euphorbia lathyris TaxID=212925 RepID=UPI003313A122
MSYFFTPLAYSHTTPLSSFLYQFIQEIMDSAQASNKSFCQKGNFENESLVSQLKIQFHEFIHSSMDDHKTCFKAKFHKAYDRVKQLGEFKMYARPNPNQDGSSVPNSTLNSFSYQIEDPFS